MAPLAGVAEGGVLADVDGLADLSSPVLAKLSEAFYFAKKVFTGDGVGAENRHYVKGGRRCGR